MGRRSKRSGKRWERDASKELSGDWTVVPGSGAFGPLMNDSSLYGDLIGAYPWFEKKFRADAKFGYGGNTQMTIKRDWFTKIRDEATKNGNDDYPCVILKFKNVRSGDTGSSKVMCINLDVWNDMMAHLEMVWEEYMELLEDKNGLYG
jgi:hypothetical protein